MPCSGSWGASDIGLVESAIRSEGSGEQAPASGHQAHWQDSAGAMPLGRRQVTHALEKEGSTSSFHRHRPAHSCLAQPHPHGVLTSEECGFNALDQELALSSHLKGIRPKGSLFPSEKEAKEKVIQ